MSKSTDIQPDHDDKKTPATRHSKKGQLTANEIALEQLRLARVQTIATVVQTIATVAGLIIAILALLAAYNSLSNKVSNVERELLSGQFIITSPENGATVGPTDTIGGQTPYGAEMHHYLVITPLEVAEDFVQDKPVNVYTGGLWTGVARFGTGDVGVGKKFTVRCVATKTELQPGATSSFPPDAQFSVPITVTRTQ